LPIYLDIKPDSEEFDESEDSIRKKSKKEKKN